MSGPAEGHLEASFVGRSGELRSLEDAVTAAVARDGVGAVVIGEAGIGKTRLVAEVAAKAQQAGVRVLWATAWEPGGAAGHWHWIQILRALAAGRDRRSLIDELGADANEVARMVPDLRSGVELAPPGDPEGDDPRFRMYDGVASFLRRASDRHPLLLVFDDLHASDLGSLRLLRFVSATTRLDPLALIGTTRDPETEGVGDDVGAALLDLQRAVPHVRLGGLERHDVETLLERALGAELAARLTPEIHRRSGGNPLFVGELAQLLATNPRGEPGVPATIRAVLERRLGAVPSASLDVLRAAAVVGEEFTVQLVEHAAGAERHQVLDALDHGVQARLIIKRGAIAFVFIHALIREVLYDQMPLSARAGAHRAVAEALEGQVGSEPPLAELAYHFLAASLSVEDGKAAVYAERAGHAAAQQLAYEDAVGHFRDALAALGLPGADSSRRVPLLLALGDAALRTGDISAARDAFGEAADDARRQGRPDLLARAALGLGSGLDGFEVRLFDHAQISLLNEALAMLPPEPSSLRSWATARLSVALTFADSESRRLRLADDAIAMARAVDDPRALAYALAARCDATAGPEHIDERLAAATEIARLAESVGDRNMELLGRRNRLIALLESGEIRGVDVEIERYELVADGLGQPLYQWYVPLWRGMRALMEGRIEAACTYGAKAASVGARGGSHNAALNADCLAWNIALKAGRLEDAAAGLARQLELADGIYGEPFWIALVTPHLHLTEAQAVLDRFSAHHFAQLPRDAVWLAALTYAADTCGVLDHAPAAGQLYDLILPHRSRFAVDAIGAASYGSMARPLGVLATVLGRRAEAAASFDEALEAHRACGASALVAETLHDLGSSLIRFGDGRRGEAALDESRALYHALGMEHRARLVPGGASISSGSNDVDAPNVFRRDGDYWTLTYRGRTRRVADAKGLHDLAALLARPGRELHVADLIATTDPSTGSLDAYTRTATLRGSTSNVILDEHARSAYRARLFDLRDELEEAEANADLGRADAARAEMDSIASELAAALGIGGLPRTQADPGERARKAVTQRIRNSLKRLSNVHPELAAHLDRSVRTGRFCSYTPEQPIEWLL